MKIKIINNIINISLAAILSSCGGAYSSSDNIAQSLDIYPDYDSVTIPRTIAPLNFTVSDSADCYIFDFVNSNGDILFSTKSKDGDSNIPLEQWKEAISDSNNSQININVGLVKDDVRHNYPSINVFLSNDAIDSHLAYRLTNPGMYGANMGIYQRSLASYDESAIIENKPGSRACMNCHTFLNNTPESFMFHMRQGNDGTVITIDGKSEKFNLKAGNMMIGAVYPSWHPGGRYIAFSINQTRQSLHDSGDKIIEVFDLNSDIVIYDTKENRMFSHKLIYDKTMAETFPSWSKDGKYLYFVSTPFLGTKNFDPLKLKYNLYRVAFNVENEELSNYELMFDAASIGKSVTVPRTYDGDRKVSMSISDYGNFFVWHNNSDLCSLDVESGEMQYLDILNSDKSDSYRCFSTNECWVVFTSRRDDGLFTRLYIAHYNKDSRKFDKPFMLPQESADHNIINERSYNLPEFITGKVNPDVLNSVVEADPKPIRKGQTL